MARKQLHKGTFWHSATSKNVHLRRSPSPHFWLATRKSRDLSESHVICLKVTWFVWKSRDLSESQVICQKVTWFFWKSRDLSESHVICLKVTWFIWKSRDLSESNVMICLKVTWFVWLSHAYENSGPAQAGVAVDRHLPLRQRERENLKNTHTQMSSLPDIDLSLQFQSKGTERWYCGLVQHFEYRRRTDRCSVATSIISDMVWLSPI